jgi:hypothetical protein
MKYEPPRRRIQCVDGFSMSVQASDTHYCTPRTTGLGFYNAYEVGFPSEAEPLLMEYAEDESIPTGTVYGYVPVQVIVNVIVKHGGITGAQDAEEYDNNHDPCAYCGEGCDPVAATPTQWQCSDCFNWNDKSQA